MKVGIAAPLSIAGVTGGVRTQVFQTVRHLQELGADVEIIRADQTQFNYDLVHVFSAGPETLGIAKTAHDSGIKLVVSPVFFSNRSAGIISTSLKVESLLSKFGSGIRSDFGIKSEICNWADMVLPNTYSELNLVRDGLGVSSKKLTMVPNGVESRFAEASPNLFMETHFKKDFILFVGQAGAFRKNVKLLLQAAPKVKATIVIIGDFYDNEYSRECIKLADSVNNVLLIETQNHDSPLLESAYAACKVFALPSMYETPGIAAMEAGLTSANIVITEKGGTRDYFDGFVEFMDPKSLDSLIEALNKAMKKDRDSRLKEHILKNFTWEIVGQKTFEIYQQILS